MFTGIVGSIGQVVEWHAGRLGVRSEWAPGLEPGASIAVNGACLTVVEVQGEVFFTEVVPETRRRTNLGLLRSGDGVNLERSLRPDQGLDGGLVQGHVDGTTRVVAVADVEAGRELDFQLPRELAPFMAEKGFITLDGASLTVTSLHDDAGTFSVALIPYTLEHTIAGQYVPGTLVNVEVDVVARYVARLVRHSAEAGGR
jgi:riboflavin synthase